MNRRLLLQFLITATTPPPRPDCEIAYFTEADDGSDGFTVECRGLSCGASPDADGSWHVSFTIWITTTMPFGPIVTRRKVPSSTLQEKLSAMLGIETAFDGELIYPSLIGTLPCEPDPNELLAKMQRLMATVELPLLYTEPNDEEEDDADSY
jgi:hypothetical protein